MIVAITGTPGTGKSALCSALQDSCTIIDVNTLAKDNGAVVGHDDEMNSDEIDIDILYDSAASLLKNADGDVLIDGHLSHLLPVDVIVVLRCHPDVIGKRLGSRGYSEEKVRENMEAEAVDVILQEALEQDAQVCEIDTTEMSVDGVAGALKDILNSQFNKYEPGSVDWSEVVLGWY